MSKSPFYTLFCKRYFLALFLMSGLLIWAPSGCAEGIVLQPAQTFPESEIVLPTPEPTPEASPSTSLEQFQVKFVEAKQKAEPYQAYVLPLSILMTLLWGFWQLVRWIYDLTTSTPGI